MTTPNALRPPQALILLFLAVALHHHSACGVLVVKYETQAGSPVSIPFETSPPTRLLNGPAWLSISDQDKQPDTDGHTPVVLILKGTPQESGLWTFNISDRVGVVSVQIEVVDSKQLAKHQIRSPDLLVDGHLRKTVGESKEALEPSLDQSLILKTKRRRRTVHEGSGHHSLGEGGDDDDYIEEDEDEEEDYEDEDGDDLLEERKLPIEPTPTLLRPPSSFPEDEPPTTSISNAVPVRMELTPTAVSYTPPSVTSPIFLPPDFVEYGSGLELEISTRVAQPASTSTSPPTPTLHKTHRNLEKLAIPSGKLFTYKIPDDIFAPADARTRLWVEPQPSGAEAYESWIWVHENDWIYALPRDRDISDYNLTLVAEGGERAEASLLVSVRQRGKWRMYNHEIEVEWGRSTLLDKGISPGSMTPAEEGVRLVREVLGGSWEDDDVIVRRLEAQGVRYKLFYTNETLLVGHSQNTCPVTELNAIAQRLRRGLDHVAIHLSGSLCEGVRAPPPKPDLPETPRATNNYPPVIRNQIDSVSGVKGEFLVHKVNADFCFDPPEEYGSRELRLRLLGEGMETLNESHWLQFDEKNWEFFGLPGESGDYTLECIDAGGKSARDALRVEIGEQPVGTEANYLTMNLHFGAADFKPSTIRKFVGRLAAAFEDGDTSNIIVRSVQESRSGNRSNIHFSFVNRTNPALEWQVAELRRVMLSNEGPPRREFVEFFRPEFEITVGELIPSRAMIGQGTINEDVKVTRAGEDDGFIKYEWMDSSQYLITFVIPGILIFIMVLLAILIACLLSRHSSKAESGPKVTRLVSSNNAILKKGVPVIFQDEYFDETERQALNESSSRSPAILREEHPPLPPEYRRHHIPAVRSNMNIQGYQPPPGFNRGHGHVPNTRPPPQHGGGFGGRGRNPPPYVPP